MMWTAFLNWQQKWMVGFLKTLIILWRWLVSSWMPPCCRFYPSCSTYALEALTSHAWPKAIALIIWRILRCNPFSKGGYDPVPPCRHSLHSQDPCAH